jgi:UDP-glucose:(heptosyl)LPS alpha-1,3-glucosyltransferase
VAIRAVGATTRQVPGWPWGPWLKRRAFAALAGSMARGFDLVHGHGDLYDQDLLSLHNCVHAAHEATHGTPLPAGAPVGRIHAHQLSGRRFRLLAANSRLMKDDVARRFGVPAEMIEVVYPGFEPTRFDPRDRERLGRPLRAGLGVAEDTVLFGLVTSGDFRKRGLVVFLRAFAAVVRECPNARALVVGKETRPGPYLQLAAELGIADRVLFLPPEPKVERLYHALDVYVHAARWEEFGMTVLEALACGVPVLTGSRVGAAELLAGEAREGILDGPSAEALTAAMLRLARDPQRRERLGALGPAAASRSSWAAHGREVLALYERLAPRTRG